MQEETKVAFLNEEEDKPITITVEEYQKFRFELYLDSKEDSDVTFSVGKRFTEIKAHKFVLAATSLVGFVFLCMHINYAVL